MSNDFQDLKDKWQSAKKSNPIPSSSTREYVNLIEEKRKSGLSFQYGNIIILGAVLIALIVFFLIIYQFQEMISRIAIGSMIGGLALRILFEVISIQKSKLIKMGDSALTTLQNSESYLAFRKKIHGPLTISIIALYTVGYYGILPELSRYFDWRIILFWAIIYIVGAVVLIKLIRKSIQKELRELSEIVALKKEILQKEAGED